MAPPAADAPGVSATLTALATAIDGEITGHFAFEEEQLFPRLAEVGDGDLGDFLAEEHEIILPLGQRLSQLARDAAEGGFDATALDDAVDEIIFSGHGMPDSGGSVTVAVGDLSKSVVVEAKSGKVTVQ